MDEIERYAIIEDARERPAARPAAPPRSSELSVRKIQYKLHEYESAPKSGTDAVAAAAAERDRPTDRGICLSGSVIVKQVSPGRE